MNRATLDGITDELGPAGSALLLLTDSGEGPASVTAAPVDAIVLIGCSPRVDESIAILRQRSVPVVAIEAEAMDGVLGIDIDNRIASRRLAEHLRSLGHEDVAIVSLPLDVARERVPLASPAVGSIHTSVERSAGVRDVYPNANGITATGSFVEEGELAGHALLADPDRRPTAVVAQSDLLAVGVIRAARELGIRVPEDLSVVGFDGVALDGIVSDDLTTMVQPAVEKGRAAARGALALIAGGDAEPVLFECTFHEGATTARVRARGN
jgi:DNA-binding LacI/PurR family transcriptional regulator